MIIRPYLLKVNTNNTLTTQVKKVDSTYHYLTIDISFIIAVRIPLCDDAARLSRDARLLLLREWSQKSRY